MDTARELAAHAEAIRAAAAAAAAVVQEERSHAEAAGERDETKHDLEAANTAAAAAAAAEAEAEAQAQAQAVNGLGDESGMDHIDTAHNGEVDGILGPPEPAPAETHAAAADEDDAAAANPPAELEQQAHDENIADFGQQQPTVDEATQEPTHDHHHHDDNGVEPAYQPPHTPPPADASGATEGLGVNASAPASAKSHAGSRHPKRRKINTCLPCKRRKVKCNREKPWCEQCRKLGIPSDQCVWSIGVGADPDASFADEIQGGGEESAGAATAGDGGTASAAAYESAAWSQSPAANQTNGEWASGELSKAASGAGDSDETQNLRARIAALEAALHQVHEEAGFETVTSEGQPLDPLLLSQARHAADIARRRVLSTAHGEAGGSRHEDAVRAADANAGVQAGADGEASAAVAGDAERAVHDYLKPQEVLRAALLRLPSAHGLASLVEEARTCTLGVFLGTAVTSLVRAGLPSFAEALTSWDPSTYAAPNVDVSYVALLFELLAFAYDCVPTERLQHEGLLIDRDDRSASRTLAQQLSCALASTFSLDGHPNLNRLASLCLRHLNSREGVAPSPACASLAAAKYLSNVLRKAAQSGKLGEAGEDGADALRRPSWAHGGPPEDFKPDAEGGSLVETLDEICDVVQIRAYMLDLSQDRYPKLSDTTASSKETRAQLYALIEGCHQRTKASIQGQQANDGADVEISVLDLAVDLFRHAAALRALALADAEPPESPIRPDAYAEAVLGSLRAYEALRQSNSPSAHHYATRIFLAQAVLYGSALLLEADSGSTELKSDVETAKRLLGDVDAAEPLSGGEGEERTSFLVCAHLASALQSKVLDGMHDGGATALPPLADEWLAQGVESLARRVASSASPLRSLSHEVDALRLDLHAALARRDAEDVVAGGEERQGESSAAD